MASMTFRFTTECEMTLNADTYEEAYLRFKDFMHGQQSSDYIDASALKVLPPESVQIFFHTDHGDEFHEIGEFKGDFREDIAARCSVAQLTSSSSTPIRRQQFRKIRLDSIPEVYW